MLTTSTHAKAKVLHFASSHDPPLAYGHGRQAKASFFFLFLSSYTHPHAIYCRLVHRSIHNFKNQIHFSDNSGLVFWNGRVALRTYSNNFKIKRLPLMIILDKLSFIQKKALVDQRGRCAKSYDTIRFTPIHTSK